MNNFNEKNGAKIFLWGLFLPQIVVLALVCIFSIFYKDLQALETELIYIISMMLVSQLSFFVIYFLFAKKSNISIKKEINKGIKTIKPMNVVWCVVISIIAILGFVYFVGLFDKFFAGLGYDEGSGVGIASTNFGWFCLNVLLSAVIPAIMEELIFRGLIFKSLKNKGIWFGVIVSSLMFMIVHLSLGSIVYPIIMGIVFCLIVQKTGSIVYSMIVHFCNNFLVLLIEYLQIVTSKSFFVDINLWWEILIVIAFAVASFVAIWFIIKHGLKPTKAYTELINENQDVIDVKNNTTNAEVAYEENKGNKFLSYIYERKASIYALLIGIAFWLIVVISSLSA